MTVYRFLLLLAGVVLASCRARPMLSTEQMDDVHQQCQSRIDDGSYTVKRSQNVGFLAERAPHGTPVVIYGASWCKACDAAAGYLTRRGIPFVEKDVEEDPAAKASLDQTLSASGLGETNVLPVIDVRGTVTLGFLPCVVDYAWSAP